MNDDKLKNMPEYVKKLPKSIRDLIFDGVWEQKTIEIARKYTLNPTQTDTLANNVLLVLIGLDTPENFVKLMTSELGISKLLADQIIEDLETRVFEQALKIVEEKEKKNMTQLVKENIEPLKPVSQENKTKETVSEKPRVPEVKPVNLPMEEIDRLPMVEKGEVAHNVPPLVKEAPTPSYKPTFNEKDKPKDGGNTLSHITYKPNNSSSEQVQKPVSVPRFTAAKIDDAPTVENTKPTAPIPQTTPQDIMNSKLNVVPEKPSTAKQVVPEVKTTPVHNYTVDPYREPME